MRSAILAVSAALLAQTASAQSCGGSFQSFVTGLKSEAASLGYSQTQIDTFFNGVAQDGAVLKADRAQGVFQKNFLDFSRSLISQNRIDNGRIYGDRYASVFDRIQREYGIPKGVLLAFWAFETDFGQVQGNFNTLNALVTLSHDCRRPELFRPQIFAALELFKRGDFEPRKTTGAWAGEIGQVQMLPKDIIENGRDGDGDGHVDLKGSSPDALMSGAAMLSSLGWRPNEPWLVEVTVPENLDWSKTGLNHAMSEADWARLGVTPRSGTLGNPNLQASVLLPVGRKGPAFLAYPNFRVYFEWNKSMVYVTTAAYFATRLMGAPAYNAGSPDVGLSGEEIVSLQRKLEARGYDVGGADGIIGEMTREAVQTEQERLGLPADAWPTRELLGRL
ncbi:lytic murein transglycosylase [Marivivens sp. LCG002]|uniref:lytic murein transglycosylase n=1 Tax=Marivivens sp. LCG002 TaxID=3051171 RepID=UPI002553EE02|nr:lytic murein transglycosylase [Marivivens sp. LCG002]WIV51008.1 lytic murein transglycosylase [Marivivens sp. LCG002]